MKRTIKDSWIEEYLRYATGQESPELFHASVAISILAAVMERNLALNRKRFILFPNLYMLLIAGSSKCHKSQAIKMGVNYIMDKLDNPPKKFSEKITPERIITFLAENSINAEGDDTTIRIQERACGYAIAPELQVFLGRKALDSGIILQLTDFYDCPDKWSYETKTSGEFTLHNVCLNFLGASTPKWLRSSLPEDAVGGGFLARTLFIFQSEPRGLVPHPEDAVPDGVDEMEKRLLHDLNLIRSLKGEFEFTPEAKDWYSEWYHAEYKKRTHEDEVDFFARWPQQILKIAMCLSIAEDNELLLTQKHLAHSDTFLNAVEAQMKPVVSTIVTADSELPTQKIAGIIERRGKVTHEEIMKYASRYVNSEGVRVILNTLQEAGEIKGYGSPGKGRYYVYQEDA